MTIGVQVGHGWYPSKNRGNSAIESAARSDGPQKERKEEGDKEERAPTVKSAL